MIFVFVHFKEKVLCYGEKFITISKMHLNELLGEKGHIVIAP